MEKGDRAISKPLDQLYMSKDLNKMQCGGTNYNSRNVNLDLLKSDTPLLPQIGGGATNARIHQSGLIDRMILTYLPITLGA